MTSIIIRKQLMKESRYCMCVFYCHTLYQIILENQLLLMMMMMLFIAIVMILHSTRFLVVLSMTTETTIIRTTNQQFQNWQEFLAKVQVTHDNTDRAFWSYLSRVYKSKSLPFRKLRTNKTILTKDNEISDELYRFYSDQFKEQSADTSNPHEVQIETECVELMNRLAIIDEEIEKTNVTEIRRHISKLKPKTRLAMMKYLIL